MVEDDLRRGRPGAEHPMLDCNGCPFAFHDPRGRGRSSFGTRERAHGHPLLALAGEATYPSSITIADQVGVNEDDRRNLRQEKAKPVIAAMKTWLEEVKPTVRPTSLLGIAIQYALDQWPRLEHYLENGHRRPDNNLVENMIRLFAVGRKHWLFSATPEGATAMAAFHSLVATATMNGLDPAAYMRAVFDHLPLANSPEDYRALLPQYIDRQLLTDELPEHQFLLSHP